MSPQRQDQTHFEREPAMIAEDAGSQELLARLERIARTELPVLVTGETGTGKELVARRIHARSPRAARPFLAVNASAFSPELVESELFGHERGAFTGALAAAAGWFEAADGGTLFLDEIGDLPLRAQVKLLRVLQSGEVTRVGSRSPLRVDVRLVTATNVDLRAALRAGTFREDLFHRLNVAALALPPLRERPETIARLCEHFLALHGTSLGRPGVSLTPDALVRLRRHTWPGNIRELENVIRRSLVESDGPVLNARALQLDAEAEATRATEGVTQAELESFFTRLLERRVPNLHQRIEAALLAATYVHAEQNQLETARLLGLSRNVVRARLIEHGAIEGQLRRPAARTSAIRVGYQKLGLMMLLKASGVLDAALAEKGQSATWCEYEGGIQIVEALRNGELDVASVGNCPAIYAQAEDVPIVYLAAEPPAPRGVALVVPGHSEVRSVSELRGKRIAVNRAAQAHYLLLKALHEANIGVEDVEITFLPPKAAQAAFRAAEVDAWAIWDPWLSSARLELGARVLRNATGLLPNPVYYLARRDFADSSASLLELLLQELRVLATGIAREPAKLAGRLAPSLEISASALASSLERELGLVPVSRELVQSQQEVADALHGLRLIPRAVSVADARWHLKLAG